MKMNRIVIAALQSVVAAQTYYHGSPEPLEPGRLKSRGKTWKSFDNKTIDEPFWVTPDSDFARQHGKFVYKTKVHIPSAQIFGDRDLVDAKIPNFSWDRGAVNEGRLLYDALDNDELFKNSSDWEGIFAEIVAGDYDTLETKEFVDWADKNGFKAANVTGDGPVNLFVFNPTDVEILEEVQVSDPETWGLDR